MIVLVLKSETEPYYIGMNQDTGFLKLVAVCAMTFDHVGKYLFPDSLILQIIGRIAFPIFAYCLVVGFMHTGNIYKYFMRLTLFAVVSQPFFTLSAHPSLYGFRENFFQLNIMFTLLIGLTILYGIREKRWIFLFIGALAAWFLSFDYGLYGILLILLFYFLRDMPKIAPAALFVWLGIRFFDGGGLMYFGRIYGIQGFAVLSLPFILHQTSFRPKINKYFFYLYYPAHLFAIALIRMIYGI